MVRFIGLSAQLTFFLVTAYVLLQLLGAVFKVAWMLVLKGWSSIQ